MLKLVLVMIPVLLLAGCGAGVYTPIGGVGINTGPPPGTIVGGWSADRYYRHW